MLVLSDKKTKTVFPGNHPSEIHFHLVGQHVVPQALVTILEVVEVSS